MTASKLIMGMVVAVIFVFPTIRLASAGRSADNPDLSALSDADLKTVTIYLTRVGCFGTCPDYELTIHGDGRVEYNGKAHVKDTGAREGGIESDAIKSLIADFAKAEYWKLDEDYENSKCNGMCFDMATAVTGLDVKGLSHHVKHYYGCGGVPRSLFKLESAIDKAANSGQWTGDVSEAGPFGTTCMGGTPGPAPK